MRCHVYVCASCCTQLDGINYCHACLKALALRPAKPRQLPVFWTTAPVLMGVWLVLFGLLMLAQAALAP
jgi:hypothetical protein